MNYRIDAAEVRRGLELLAPPVFELRVLNCVLKGERRSGTYSGYFDAEHHDAVVEALGRIESAAGCYFTPNPVSPKLLARSPNRARIIRDREPTTTDRDIIERKWLLIDIDPVRPAGISSTTAEKAAAEGVATNVDYWAWEQGFGPGVFADSGNGIHLLLPLRLPADDGKRCERLLKYLDREFSTAQAKVDVTTFNASRIWRLYGTMACKGADCPDLGRPWRLSRILTVCKELPRDKEDATRS